MREQVSALSAALGQNHSVNAQAASAFLKEKAAIGVSLALRIMSAV